MTMTSRLDTCKSRVYERSIVPRESQYNKERKGYYRMADIRYMPRSISQPPRGAPSCGGELDCWFDPPELGVAVGKLVRAIVLPSTTVLVNVK